VPTLSIVSGEQATLWWAADSSKRFRGKEYFDKLDPSERAKFDALFGRMAAVGTIRNTEHFRKESENIYCFKRGQHRISCYREGNALMLLHGFRKKSDTGIRLRREIQTAERLRAKHVELTQGNDQDAK
jgi:hypothetical protein